MKYHSALSTAASSLETLIDRKGDTYCRLLIHASEIRTDLVYRGFSRIMIFLLTKSTS